MRMYDIILKKREGLELSPEEIRFFVEGYISGVIPDYQAASFLMAIYFRGLTPLETMELTMAMVNSGEKIDLSTIPGCKVDKHSTGGVGDKTTLVLAPLVAAAGVPVAKLSGRGLGHTGGTIDKLESIPGFQTEMETKAFIRQVQDIGVAVAVQTDNLVPADKKLYSLRDVTATVESIPLIASSVMSKKIAAGADAIVLDVKTGSGALLQEKEAAFSLARSMVAIGRQAGRAVIALVTNMNQPLGYAVGNALEVWEAIDTLKGKGPLDLEQLCLTLGGYLLLLAQKVPTAEEGKARLLSLLKNEQALEKFREMVMAQHGDSRVIGNPHLLPGAKRQEVIYSGLNGYVVAINAKEIGRAAMLLGAGRQTKGAGIDHGVGVVLHKKIGDLVKAGEPLATVYVNQSSCLEEALLIVQRSFYIEASRPEKEPLVYGLVTL